MIQYIPIGGAYGVWKVVPCPTKSMLCLIFAWLNNLSGIEILPSLSNWRLTLSAKTEVAKISLFSSNGVSESIEFDSFYILFCEHPSIEGLLNDG